MPKLWTDVHGAHGDGNVNWQRGEASMQDDMTMGAAPIVGTAPATGASRANVAVTVTCAALLGVFLLWGVGFSHVDVFHNVAHDTRHSNAFPCH